MIESDSWNHEIALLIFVQTKGVWFVGLGQYGFVWGLGGSRGGCLKKGAAGTPLQTMITLIIVCIDAGCKSSAGDIPLIVSLTPWYSIFS